MKYILPLVVASLMVAIATAMREEGPLTLPFLTGYLLGIVVPLVVYSGILTLVARLSYRMFTRRDVPNLPVVVWSIWALVAAVNYYGNYQNQKERRAETIGDSFSALERASDDKYHPSAVLSLQAEFARDSKQLDAELARKVVAIQIPALFDPAFLQDKTRFPAATEQLEEYGQAFQTHIDARMNMLSQMKAEIGQLDLPQNEKKQAFQEFNNTYEIDAALTQKYYDIVIEVSRQGIAYLDFMERARYSVLNGQAIFEAEHESQEYETLVRSFQQLSEQEAIAQQKLAESREERMTRMRELSR
jgi:hypothetical protein